MKTKYTIWDRHRRGYRIGRMNGIHNDREKAEDDLKDVKTKTQNKQNLYYYYY